MLPAYQQRNPTLNSNEKNAQNRVCCCKRGPGWLRYRFETDRCGRKLLKDVLYLNRHVPARVEPPMRAM